ncbi:hypothetical protein AMAG_15854 [Allomyces macrogynus ATCC 38327]|uniref:Uncharacterized protein n=1 Tax=Allomyces macrogynus (strain ATCC 38327) TaxID=578462 RepID=A0A0L0T9G9_ALLM3|nr:hypothetical protein AMAG_15854 [Allomyces macrogynus ATCC 38327]|eukprot:KNE71194.1 hypothetical protein AMAG_15854 [Allomyces macrogynus ATCC 38327]
MVQLPSQMEGGELVVLQESTKPGSAPTATSLSLGQWDRTSAYGAHYAVIYRGAEHKFEPIKNGYRLALVYSLQWPKGKQGMPRIMRGINARIAEELASLSRAGQVLRYIFDVHLAPQESRSSLPIQNFVGADKARLVILKAANALLPAKDRLTFFFANECRTIRALDEGKDDDGSSQAVAAPDFALTHWFHADGRPMVQVKPKSAQATSLDITVMAGILNPERKSHQELWAGRRATDSEHKDGVKNKKTILVAVPRAIRVRFAEEHINLTVAHDLLLEDPRNDQAWFDAASATLLQHACKFDLTKAAVDLATAFPGMFRQTDTADLVAKLVKKTTWPVLRDLVHGAVHTLPRQNRCAQAVAILAELVCHVNGVARDEWSPFATMAVAALDPDLFPRRLPSYAHQLVHALLQVGDVTLAMQVISRPDFSTLFETFEANLAPLVTSWHWLDVRDAVLAQVAKAPEFIRVYACTAAAHAAMRAKVEETAWAPVLLMAVDAIESVVSVQKSTELA